MIAVDEMSVIAVDEMSVIAVDEMSVMMSSCRGLSTLFIPFFLLHKFTQGPFQVTCRTRGQRPSSLDIATPQTKIVIGQGGKRASHGHAEAIVKVQAHLLHQTCTW